jgi:DNA-binding MarR family transcriptional regulator
MGTTGAKTSSVEAVLDILRQHPDVTAAEVAEHASIGRSTATRTLANLETQGRVTRRRGKAEAGGRPAPDHWTLATDTTATLAETERQPEAEESTDEQTDVSAVVSQDQDRAGQNAPASGGAADTASPETEAATTDAAESTSKDSGPRLRPGELRALVHAFMAERPGQELTPTKIGKELGRSAGAVGNALATMTDAGEVTQTSTKPRKYTLAAQPAQPAGTHSETAKAS